ncbi:MAG: peptidoglycan D,D-transpeptidase FtsI family protein [Desertimonas sp.]
MRARNSILATRFSAGQPRQRLLAALVVMLMMLGAVLLKVGALQTWQGDSLRTAAAQQWTRDRVIDAERGAIFDRNGNELALSVPASTISVNPMQLEDADADLTAIGDILELDAARLQELRDDVATCDCGFVYVARQVPTALGEQIDELDLVGVHVVRESRRTVPGGETAISVIGRTDIDGIGTAGLELQYDDVLTGIDGETRVEIAPDGRSVAGTEAVLEAPVPGRDLVLTIDRSVQHNVEQTLLQRVAASHARGGQVVVLDTDTGDVLAMASVILEDGVYEITSGNHSAVDAYEPGSVGKVITIAGALNEGLDPSTTWTVPWEKVYTRAGDKLHDSHPHEPEAMNVRDILVKSSNIGTISVSETMGFEKQYEYIRAFGLGEETALDFPGESPGILKFWQEWEGTEKFTVAYGQGLSSSPIQLATAVNVIANDGVYVAPRLVLATVDADGDLHDADAAAQRQVISEEVAVEVQSMMRDVVCRSDGTANAAQVPGLSIAGKTGTGLVAQPDGTYFLEDGTQATYSSFAGFFPAEDPQVTVLVSIDQPMLAGQRAGGTAAAPAFQDLAPMLVQELGLQIPVGSTGCEG